MGVSKNRGTPKSSILIGVFHYFHHPFWGYPYFWKHPYNFLAQITELHPYGSIAFGFDPPALDSMLQMIHLQCAEAMWLFVGKTSKSLRIPEIYRIDTKNGHYLEGVHLFQTIILGIHVSFRGCII